MPRILAIDYGTKRCGIAISDPTKTIANPLETVSTQTLKEWLRTRVNSNEDIEAIVVGLPTQMNGLPSQTAAAAEALCAWLKKEFPRITIAREDERFTSKIAHRTMLEGGLKKTDRRDKALVDRISATIILQSYLDKI